MAASAQSLPASTGLLRASSRARRLATAERNQYLEQGYVNGLPVFAAPEVELLQRRFHELAAKVPVDVDINRINMWHKANRWLYDLCRTPAILDYIEDIIGPDFYQWGGQFFVKYPGDGSEVPWHQDSQYWPLTPATTVTVWLALYDADDDNGAMQVVRGSHRRGELPHHEVDDPHFVLEQAVDDGNIDPADVVSLNLRAGELSLHDSALLHGSAPNRSNRTRAGLTMRFSPSEVRCDLSVWPTFEVYPARGQDRYRHNPIGKVPAGDGSPGAKFQPSSDFE